jgi:hypothetical protein
VQYQKGTAPYNASEPQPVNFTTVVGEVSNATTASVPYEEVGTETFDGVQVTRYEASGEELARSLGLLNGTGGTFQNVTFVSASTELLIDGDGIVRRASFDVVVDTEQAGEVTISFSQEITAVGSTSVPEPDWLEEAMQQTGG